MGSVRAHTTNLFPFRLLTAQTACCCVSVHLEMRWHHSFHFMLWGRPHLAQRADRYFDAVREPAREFTKQRQGYSGVRWVRLLVWPSRS